MVNAYGYTKIRTLLQTTGITHIEIRNGSQAAIVRIPVGDSRVSVYAGPETSPLGYQVVLTSSDPDMGLVTIGGFAFYDVATGGSALIDDTFSNPVTFSNSADKATLKLNITTPL